MDIGEDGVDSVMQALRHNVSEVMPDVDGETVSIDARLADYGCNSIDRADIVSLTIEELGIDLPVTEFAGVENIRDLVRVLSAHLTGPE